MGTKLKTAAGCLLFASIFGAVGVFASWVIVGSLYDGYRAKEWVLTSAMVDFYDSTAVTYHYKVGGREYTGDRMGTMVIGGKDSIDDWHAEMDARLTAAKNDKTPIMVRVNPDNPAESMVNADIRWQPLVFFIPFALGFGGVGVGALVMLFRTFVPQRSGGQGSGLATTWFFTIMWNAIAMPISFLFVPRIIADEEWVGLFVLIFPLVGVLLLWGALYATWKAFVGLFNRGGAVGGLDLARKASTLKPAELHQVRVTAAKKHPKMVESNPEVLREMEQDNGVRPAMAGMVSPLPDSGSRRLQQEDAAESALARLTPEQRLKLKEQAAKVEVVVDKVKKFTRGGNLIFWVVIAVIVLNSGLLGALYQFVRGLVQGDPAP